MSEETGEEGGGERREGEGRAAWKVSLQVQQTMGITNETSWTQVYIHLYTATTKLLYHHYKYVPIFHCD